MFDMGTPAWNIVIRTALVFLAVFVGLRLIGKRELGQMTVFDLVVILLIANAVQNAMVGPDFSVQEGLIAAFVLPVADRAMAFLRLRGSLWGRLIEGTPTVLVEDGEFVPPHLRKEGLDREEVEMVIREHGMDSGLWREARRPGDGRSYQHRAQDLARCQNQEARSSVEAAMIAFWRANSRFIPRLQRNPWPSLLSSSVAHRDGPADLSNRFLGAVGPRIAVSRKGEVF